MTRCPGSGRVVSQQNLRRGIYTTHWLTRCAWHNGTAGYRLAEVKPEGGYVTRYVEHDTLREADPKIGTASCASTESVLALTSSRRDRDE